MTVIDALLYGLVQGITEYLPISSSAHLILLPRFLGEKDPGLTFDVFLHLGTLFATLVYFRRDWQLLFLSLLKRHGKAGTTAKLHRADVNWRLIIIATIPALIAGALLHSWVRTVLRGPEVLVFSLSIGGILLFLADRFFPKERLLSQIRDRDALKIGLFQCLALIPGVSRSGATITGARFLGLDRAAAARFSFIISAPITAAAVVFELRNWRELVEAQDWFVVLVAGVSSFVFGYLAIGFLLKMLRRFGYLSFAIYRLVLAGVVAAVLL